MKHTVKDCGHPVEDSAPQVDPTNEMKIVWRVRFPTENNEDSFVKYGDWA
jgi:hypothetical protein